MHFQRKGKRVRLSWNDCCFYNSLLLKQHRHGKLSYLPASMPVLDCWEFFVLHLTEGSHWPKKWNAGCLIASVISAVVLLPQHRSVCLSFLFLPLARELSHPWGPVVPLGCLPASRARALAPPLSPHPRLSWAPQGCQERQFVDTGDGLAALRWR